LTPLKKIAKYKRSSLFCCRASGKDKKDFVIQTTTVKVTTLFFFAAAAGKIS
jgi:hypothetical protein